MSEPLDNLNIQIEAEATKAVNELDKLTEKLGNVGGKLTEIAKNPLKIDLSVSGGATKQVDKLAQYADKVAKDMSKHFQEAFNIPNSSMAGIKNLTKQFVDMGITGREGTMKAMSAIESGDLDLANELIRAASAGQEADAVMKSFYDTVKSISKIYISPDMLPTDAWKDMDGLLRQKFTTQPSSGATSIDQYFQEWNEEFPSLFGGLNTDTEQDQFEALTQVVRQCREEIERPLQTQSGEIADGVWQELIEQADVLARKGENAKAVLNDLNIPTVSTENTGFSDLASSLQKISKVSAENLASVGQAIVQMSEGLQSLNGVTFNLAPFEQLAYVAEKLNKIPTVSTATLENVTLIGQALKGLSGVQLDGIGGITADLAELSRGLRDLGKNPVDGIKEIQNAAKPLSEVRAELDEQFKDLGKDWDFTGNIQTKIQSLQNSLAEATSKAQSLETSGKFSGKGYADAVRQINEYTNKIAVLEDKLKPLNEGELNPDVQIRLNGGDTTRSIEDFEATYTELKTLLEGGYSVKPAIVNTINELIDELPEADAEINKFKELLAQANEAAQGSNTSPKFQFDTSQFEQATSAVEDFEQRLENIKPMDFSGSMFELEKFVADLNAKRAQLEQKSSDLDILGVGVDTQRVQQVQLSLERINKTLEIYEEKLNEARAAGELDIKIAPLDTGALDEAENKIVGFGEIFHRFTIPTEQFYEIQDEMDAVKEKYDALADTINSKAQDTQFYGTTKDYANKMAELESLRQEYERLKAEQDGLGNLSISDKAATVFGKFGTAGEVASGAMETFKQKLSAVQGTLKKFESFCSKVVSAVKKFGSAIKKVIAPTSSAKKSVDKFSLSNNGLAKALTKTVKMLKLMVVRMALRGVIDGVKTGFENLAQYSEEVNANMSLLMNSLNQTKNAFAAMVSPIFNVVAPALNYLIQMLITASNCINQLFSALTGNSTWTKATLLTEDYAESVSDAADATDDLYSTTLGIDELNINSGDTSSSGSGSSSGTDASDMFTTEEVESEYIDFADKIKSIIDDLFSTLKSAWDTEGLYVMDSWKNALNSIWELIKSIGSDFLEVWKQPATVEIFEDILAIIGDIGQSIANLADGFREAWEENDTGLHILENIRDCIGLIVENIREAADYTVEWTANLDFSPLLEAFERFTNSLKPVVDNLSGILTDFYTDVLLPFAKWTLEKGLPELLDVFTAFNDKVDWNALRENLKTFWEHVEPLAETVGEGLVLFIEDVSNLVADFINSETFINFLDKLQDWMDKQTAEDVAKDIELLAGALIALKLAGLGLSALKGITSIVQTISDGVSAISKVGAGISKLAGTLGKATGLSAAWKGLGGLSGILNADVASIMATGTTAEIGLTIGTGLIGGITAAVGGFALGEWINEQITGEDIDMSWSEQFATIKETFTDGSWKEAISLWGQDIYDAFVLVGEQEDALFSGIGDWLNTHIAEPVSKWWKTDIVGAFSLWGQDIASFWEEHVAPWFTLEKWQELGQGILDGIAVKWEEFKTWWSETAIVTWWEEHVAPWFTLKKWQALADNIKEGIKTKWNDTVVEWKTNISTWWEKHVAPWFTLEKWQETLSSVPEAFKEAFKNAANGAIGFLNNVIGGVESMVNAAISALAKLAEAVNTIPGVDINFSSWGISLPRIPTFAEGGYPDVGSLFIAGEAGAEFVTSINGRTGVASNDEVTGIREEVAALRESNAALQNTVISLLEVIASKDTTLEIDGREIAKAIDNRKSRNGYAFT